MSLMRAFTTRRNKPDMELPNMTVHRAASKRSGRPIMRSQISSPVALLSTTNVQSYEAPAIQGTSPIHVRSHSPECSSSESDSDASTLSLDTSGGNVTDASSIDSPIDPEPEPNHLSCYFKPSIDTRSPSRSPSVSTRASFDAPAIPQRVPSHSKKAHENVHRKRSIRRMMSPAGSIRSNSGSGSEFFSPTRSAFVDAPKESPFGSELAQLDEVAEEFNVVVRDAEANEDAGAMLAHGLGYFSALEYLSEIETLIYATFAEDGQSWI